MSRCRVWSLFHYKVLVYITVGCFVTGFCTSVLFLRTCWHMTNRGLSQRTHCFFLSFKKQQQIIKVLLRTLSIVQRDKLKNHWVVLDLTFTWSSAEHINKTQSAYISALNGGNLGDKMVRTFGIILWRMINYDFLLILIFKNFINSY